MTTTADKPALPATTTGGAMALPAAALAKLAKAKHHDEIAGSDMLIPWLSIIQPLSNALKRNNEGYIAGAQIGDIYDNVTKKTRAAAYVLLVKFETHYTTWKPGGGKLVKMWHTDATGYNAAKDDGHPVRLDAEGNEIKPSKVYYILDLDLDTGAARPMIWSLGGTQAKKSRRINTLAKVELETPDGPIIPPLYARIFELTTRDEQWTADKSGPGWVAEVGGVVLANEKFGERWWAMAEAFRDQIDAGNVRPQPPSEQEASETGDGENQAPSNYRGADQARKAAILE